MTPPIMGPVLLGGLSDFSSTGASEVSAGEDWEGDGCVSEGDSGEIGVDDSVEDGVEDAVEDGSAELVSEASVVTGKSVSLTALPPQAMYEKPASMSKARITVEQN